MYSLLLAIIYIAFISLGLPDSLVGAAWPVMHTDLDVPVSYAGVVTMIIAIGTIISSLQSDRLTKKFGPGLVTAVSVGMTAAALIGFSFSGSFLVLCLWAIPYGLGAGAVDAALNNYVALHYESRHMSWLHCFWGIGASISPFIMGYSLTAGHGWSNGYWIVGIIQVVLTVALFASLPLWKKQNGAHREGVADGETDEAPAAPLALSRAVKIPGVPLVMVAFMSYCAVEATTILWASTYLVDSRGVDPATAARFASLFLLGITLGRFLTGFIADALGDRQMIRYGSLIALAGIVLIALPLETDILALGGLVIAGFGCAPIYPAIIHSTPANFGRQNSQAIIGIQMASAYMGTTLMPPLFGFLAERTDIVLFPLYVGIFAVALLALTELLNRKLNIDGGVGVRG
ncbi:MFS transporter [Actinomycetaceae bacterium L2_0104]